MKIFHDSFGSEFNRRLSKVSPEQILFRLNPIYVGQTKDFVRINRI